MSKGCQFLSIKHSKSISKLTRIVLNLLINLKQRSGESKGWKSVKIIQTLMFTLFTNVDGVP